MAPSLLSQVQSYCAREEAGVRLDAEGGTLFDVAARKMLPLRAAQLERAEVRQEPHSGADYLFLRYLDGTELLLTPMGVAFAPDTTRSGPHARLPPFCTLRDYQALREEAAGALVPEQPPTREGARALLACVAVLEGARQAGFEVRGELHTVSGLLRELEQRLPVDDTEGR
jgi:hypothetical protein